MSVTNNGSSVTTTENNGQQPSPEAMAVAARWAAMNAAEIAKDIRVDLLAAGMTSGGAHLPASTLAIIERHLAAALTTAKAQAYERATQIAEADKGVTDCPYATDRPADPTWNHTDEDTCPACGQIGLDDGSKCFGLARQRIAERIRALSKTEAQNDG